MILKICNRHGAVKLNFMFINSLIFIVSQWLLFEYKLYVVYNIIFA